MRISAMSDETLTSTLFARAVTAIHCELRHWMYNQLATSHQWTHDSATAIRSGLPVWQHIRDELNIVGLSIDGVGNDAALFTRYISPILTTLSDRVEVQDACTVIDEMRPESRRILGHYAHAVLNDVKSIHDDMPIGAIKMQCARVIVSALADAPHPLPQSVKDAIFDHILRNAPLCPRDDSGGSDQQLLLVRLIKCAIMPHTDRSKLGSVLLGMYDILDGKLPEPEARAAKRYRAGDSSEKSRDSQAARPATPFAEWCELRVYLGRR